MRKKMAAGAMSAVAAMWLALGVAQAEEPPKKAAKPAKLAKAAKTAEPAAEPEPPKDAATLEFEKARAEMEASNPAELFEMAGEELWTKPRGPKNVSLAETCDLGQGIGKVEGAYVAMPRYFADANAVMDTERRIIWCMVEKQGFKLEDLAKKPFAKDSYTPDQTSLVTFVASKSKGMKFAVPLNDPKVKDAYLIGKEIFSYRAGPYDFSCSTCHGAGNKRIRMQQLPNLSTTKGALSGVQGWPGYRMTGSVMLTFQWRMADCFRQQRFPEPRYVSDALAYLITYVTANANGEVYKGPGIKR